METSLSNHTQLAVPITTHPFYITVDASQLGLAAKLFQANTDNKMQVMTYNSRILTTQEQKLSTYDSALCAIVFVVSKYAFLILDSKFPITVFSDHTPILFRFTRNGNLTLRQYEAQMVLPKLSNLSNFSHSWFKSNCC